MYAASVVMQHPIPIMVFILLNVAVTVIAAHVFLNFKIVVSSPPLLHLAMPSVQACVRD